MRKIIVFCQWLAVVLDNFKHLYSNIKTTKIVIKAKLNLEKKLKYFFPRLKPTKYSILNKFKLQLLNLSSINQITISLLCEF